MIHIPVDLDFEKERKKLVDETIRLHAYLKAEKDAFRKAPEAYWLEAEKEIYG